MPEKDRFPIRYGRGHSKVTIYNRTTALPYFRLCYRFGPVRHQSTFNCLEQAIIYAQRIEGTLRSKDAGATQLTRTEAAQFQSAQALLNPLGERVDQAVYRYIRITEKLGEISPEKAIDFFLKHHPSIGNELSLQTLVDRFLASKSQEGISEAYYHDLRKRLRSLIEFAEDKSIKLMPQTLASYFDALNFKAVNHNNQIRAISAFIHFAQAHGYLSKQMDFFQSVAKKKVRPANYAVYQPKEFTALLNAANDDMKPVLILLGHCGIRPAELMRLSWNEVKLKLKTVIIGSHQAKTASRRTIPITKTTAQLLELFHKANQPIWKKNHGQWNKALNRLHRQAGIQQIPNGLRHSYISYRLVITADINRTALEAGNSPAIIYRHYQALIDDPQLAQDWFAIKLNANALKEFHGED